MKDKILRAIGGIPAESLYNYINQGTVTYQELVANGLDNYPDKKQFIISKMSAGEKSAWLEAQQKNTVEAYEVYISMYPDGEHIEDARRAFEALEDNYWMYIQQNMSEQILDDYLRIYPKGKYVSLCIELKGDLPWLDTKKRNTIEGYNIYKLNYPGKHTAEIEQAIAAIVDKNDWEHAEQVNTTSAYKSYLEKHPQGQYAAIAKERIANRSQNEIIKDAIRKDDNTFSTFDLQQKVENGTLTWEDLREVFSDAQVQAIKDWRKVTELPYCPPPSLLLRDSTEIYFWGTRGTGKTCAIGAILSAANKNGIFIPLNCRHGAYMAQLSNLFSSEGGGHSICNLPDSTRKESISELNLELVDEKRKKHKVTLIDLAGETVTGIYKLQNDIPMFDEEKNTVNQVLSYLNDPHNNKIHFFVLEYGAANKEVKELSDIGIQGVHQVNILTSIAQFLDQKGGLRKSTVGVYGLVSKSDRIDEVLGTPIDMRPKKAKEYVNQNLTSFWSAIKLACENANVKDVRTISFSIGDVFAKNLCVFDGADSMKIINRLLVKTKTEPEGFLKWLFS